MDIVEPHDCFAETGPEDLCIISTLRREEGAKDVKAVVVVAEYESKDMISSLHQPQNALGSLLGKGLAVESRRGRHIGPSQDSVLVGHARGYTVFAIAAGRGENGHLASEWVVQCAMSLALSEVINIPSLPDEYCMRRIYNICNDALQFYGQEHDIDFSISGSMLSMCFIEKETLDCSIAWIGDSKMLLAKEPGNSGECSSPELLTSAYDPRTPHASRRKSYEEVVSTVWMLGNFAMRMDGTNPSQPTTRQRRLQKGDCFICCSDGVWEHVDHNEATSIVLAAGPSNPLGGVQSLLEAVKTTWDDEDDAADVSAIVCWV